jgi:hypothetical protein
VKSLRVAPWADAAPATAHTRAAPIARTRYLVILPSLVDPG